ncbi:ABC transporter substrate-binding protein [Halomonas organivorans]|uniref:Glycine betaine/proline transport system substrate-binding protein n=1 Tax=Halomonas organivorans TaxID=257772 RepID=A0A7W5G7S7_9GAMM|nr:ABC transporter substrate-binding protein [Halomonas organivorans]MBB3143252.1 glycine betaine/proline transport system substrate-binding protein [Halomonas organivorans]
MPLSRPTLAATALSLAGLASLPAQAALEEVRFGVPPWPGVTVKSEVAAQLLEAMGYETRQNSLAVSVILNGVAEGDLDVYLGGWYPVQTDMVEPLVDDGKVVKAAANIQGATSGLVVPRYVHDAGITSVADLNAHRERFDGTIQGIEAGTGINTAIGEAIDNDLAGLGGWTLRESSTAAMLAQAEQKMRDGEWVTFVGWEPHWMNVSFDLVYLDDAEDAGIADIESTVWTVVPASLEAEDADLYRFMTQYVVDIEDQNDWIHAYSYEERPADEVAREWIGEHLDTVAGWLAGVEALDGRPAIEAVKAGLD